MTVNTKTAVLKSSCLALPGLLANALRIDDEPLFDLESLQANSSSPLKLGEAADNLTSIVASESGSLLPDFKNLDLQVSDLDSSLTTPAPDLKQALKPTPEIAATANGTSAGDSVTTKATVGSGFNCTAGEKNWETGWSEEKKKFCCTKFNVGCAERETLTYDCDGGAENWKKGWSDPKKRWCCKHHKVGCAETLEKTSAVSERSTSVVQPTEPGTPLNPQGMKLQKDADKQANMEVAALLKKAQSAAKLAAEDTLEQERAGVQATNSEKARVERVLDNKIREVMTKIGDAERAELKTVQHLSTKKKTGAAEKTKDRKARIEAVSEAEQQTVDQATDEAKKTALEQRDQAGKAELETVAEKDALSNNKDMETQKAIASQSAKERGLATAAAREAQKQLAVDEKVKLQEIDQSLKDERKASVRDLQRQAEEAEASNQEKIREIRTREKKEEEEAARDADAKRKAAEAALEDSIRKARDATEAHVQNITASLADDVKDAEAEKEALLEADEKQRKASLTAVEEQLKAVEAKVTKNEASKEAKASQEEKKTKEDAERTASAQREKAERVVNDEEVRMQLAAEKKFGQTEDELNKAVEKAERGAANVKDFARADLLKETAVIEGDAKATKQKSEAAARGKIEKVDQTAEKLKKEDAALTEERLNSLETTVSNQLADMDEQKEAFEKDLAKKLASADKAAEDTETLVVKKAVKEAAKEKKVIDLEKQAALQVVESRQKQVDAEDAILAKEKEAVVVRQQKADRANAREKEAAAIASATKSAEKEKNDAQAEAESKKQKLSQLEQSVANKTFAAEEKRENVMQDLSMEIEKFAAEEEHLGEQILEQREGAYTNAEAKMEKADLDVEQKWRAQLDKAISKRKLAEQEEISKEVRTEEEQRAAEEKEKAMEMQKELAVEEQAAAKKSKELQEQKLMVDRQAEAASEARRKALEQVKKAQALEAEAERKTLEAVNYKGGVPSANLAAPRNASSTTEPPAANASDPNITQPLIEQPALSEEW